MTASPLCNFRNKVLLFSVCCAFLTMSVSAQTGTWNALSNLAPHYNLGVMLLLTDGTVICKNSSGGNDLSGSENLGIGWDRLTPVNGSYLNGSWSSIASMDSPRLYFSTQVLRDGRVYVCGGEYGGGGKWGEIYNPRTNTWSFTGTGGAGTGHPFLYTVSDANSEMLPSGQILQALVDEGGTNMNYLWNPATNTYTAGPNCLRIDNEAVWVKLPDSSVLFMDNYGETSERYIPATNTWVNDATAPENVFDPYGEEAGAGFLLPNGKVWFIGSLSNTLYYTPSGTASPGTWAIGPSIPDSLGAPDASAVMLPNGHILLTLSHTPDSANHFPSPTSYYEFDYTTNTFTAIGAPGGGTTTPNGSFISTMLMLPDGTALFCNQGTDQYYQYVPGSAALAAGRPIVTAVDSINCDSFLVTGKLFNGISEGAAYGDDWQMNTNYPVARLTSGSNVYYATSYNWNRIGAVMTGAALDTFTFRTPVGLPAGTYSLQVIANGNPSANFIFTHTPAPGLSPVSVNICAGSNTSLTDAIGGGAWSSSNTAIATISGGAVTGLSGGTTIISYTLGDGCSTAETVTVSTTPPAITGMTYATVGGESSLADATTGTWSSANSAIASVNALTGAVTGVATGTTTISYINSCGSTAISYTVVPGSLCIPSPTAAAASCSSYGLVFQSLSIAGTASTSISDAAVCNGSGYLDRTALSCIFNKGNSYTATVSEGGYPVTVQFWIDLNGDGVFQSSESVGGTTSLTSSGSITLNIPATAIAGTYRMRGIMNYTGEGHAYPSLDPCMTGYSFGEARDYTVIIPCNTGAINGAGIVCAGATTNLSDTTAGGTWSSSNTAIATVNSSGIVKGISGGTAVISYFAGTCASAAALTVNAAPVLTVTPALAAFCRGSSTTIAVSGANTYNWSPATGLSASSGASVTCTASVTTTYTVTGANASGCTGTAIQTITINPVAVLTITPSSSAICKGSSTSITVSGASTYNWLPATGLTTTTGATVTCTASVTTTYTVTGVNASGCSGTTIETTTVNPLPVLTITPTSSVICSGSSTPIVASGASLYSWSPATGLSAPTGVSVTCTASVSTTYTITGTNASGCTGSAIQTITVNPVPVLTVTPVSSVICNGSSTAITASGASTYVWLPAAGLNASSGASVTCTASVTTTYTITGTASCGTSTVTQTITVNKLPTVLTATVTPNTVCQGSPVNLKVTATGGVGSITYIWTGGTSAIVNSTSIIGTASITSTAAADNNTVYTLTATAAGCGNAVAHTNTLTVNSAPNLGVNTASGQYIYTGGSTTLHAYGGVGYTWAPATGLSATTGATIVATPATNTTYTITATNTFGCGSSTVYATVYAQGALTGSSACAGSTLTLPGFQPAQVIWQQNGIAISTVTPAVSAIYTISGTGTLYDPQGIFLDAAGNIYIADQRNNRIEKSAAGSGAWATAAGTGTAGAGAAQLNNPVHLYVDASGNIYVSDNGNNRIQEFPAGSAAGTAGITVGSGLSGPDGICVDASGNIYASNGPNILKFTPGNTTGVMVAGTGIAGTGATQLGAALGICTDAAGNLYVADVNNNRIQKFAAGSTSGTAAVTVASVGLTHPADVYVDGGGNIFVADGLDGMIQKFPSGSAATTAGTLLGTVAGGHSYGIRGDNSGNIYATDYYDTTIVKYAAGTVAMSVTATSGANYSALVTIGAAAAITNTVIVNALPVLTVTPVSAAICNGASTSITASGASTYNWSPATGLSVSTGATVSCTASVTTTYTITGTNASGCTGTAIQTVTVNPVPVLTVTPALAAICAGSSISITASGAATYNWSPAAGLSAATGATVICTPGVTTTYTVTGTSASGCAGIAVQTITVNPLPNLGVNTGTGQYIYNGGSTTLNAYGGASYTWAPATGLSVTTGASTVATPSITTTYTITGTTALGCTTAVQATVFAAGALTGTTGCAGSVVTLPGVQPAQIIWQQNGISISTVTPSLGSGITIGSGTLNHPSGIYTDAAGNMYVGDHFGSYISKLAAGSGTWVIVAGTATGGGGAAQLNGVRGIYVDASGNIFASDNGNNRIQEFPAGSVSGTSAITVATGLNSPDGVYVDGTGNIYVADIYNNGIQKFTPGNTTGVIVAGTGTAGTGAAQLNAPSDVKVDASGNIYVADWNNGRIQKFPAGSTSGTAATTVAAAGLHFARSVYVDGSGNIFTADQTQNIWEFPAGSTSATTGTLLGTVSQPFYICGDSKGNIYVTSTGNAVVEYAAGPVTMSVTATNAGNYSALVTIGSANVVTNTVTVNAVPVITVTPTPAAICNGSSTSITASGASTYIWSPATGLSIATGATVSCTANTTTTYTVTGVSASGCTGTATQIITVNPIPVITVTPTSAAICYGSSTSITASGAGSYSWLPAVGLNVSTGATVGCTGSVTTTYTVTGTNASGCTNTATENITVNPLPVLTITPTSSVLCSGSSTSVTASGASIYNWSPAAGLSASTGATVNCTPSVTTTYTVTGITASGCAGTAMQTITVNSTLVLTVTPTSAAICNGSSTSITASGASTYSWLPVIGLGTSTGATVSCTASVTTTYTVTGINASGCTGIAIQTVTVNPIPVLTVTPTSAVICNGASIVITASGAGTYSWLPAAGLNVSTGAAVGCTAGVTTTYTITGTNAFGCTNTATKIITVNPLPVLTITPTSSVLCSGSSTSITASGASAYNWSPAAGLSAATGVTVICTPSVTTTYTVTGMNASGCTGTAMQTITVNSTLALTVTPTSAAICNGTSTSITSSGASTYNWSPATGLSVATGAVVSCTASVTTTYTVTGSAGSCSATATKTITVNPLPVLTVTPTLSVICNGSSTSITASGAGTYIWSPAAGMSTPTGAAVLCTASVTTTYTITGTNASGCSGTALQKINVNALPVLTITPASVTICGGTSASVTASGASTYSWLPATGLSVFTGASVICTASVTTTYTVTGSVGSCSNSAQGIVTVISAPSIPAAIAGGTSLCTGTTITLTDGTAGGTWSSSNAAIASINSATGALTGIAAGVATLSYSITNSCGTSRTTRVDTVKAAPVSGTISGTSSLSVGTTATLTATVAGGAWSSSNAVVASVSAAGLTKGISAGTATISYAVTNSCGTAYATFSVTVGSSALIQIITTIAGNHTAGFSGDGGAATSAALLSPSGIAVTSTGIIYFTDQANNRVRKIATSGIITTIAGNGITGSLGDGGAATSAELNDPMGVAVDVAGNVYIAEYGNNKIRKVNTAGIISTFAGTGTIGYSADGTVATAAEMARPTGVAADAAGNIYYVEQTNDIVRKINTSGIISTIAGNRGAGYSGDGGLATSAAISYPMGVLPDGLGNIYIVDAGNNRIRKVTAAGIISTVAGNGVAGYSGDGGSATAAEINNPGGIAFDSTGALLIGDLNNNRIRRVTTAGIISTISGTGAGGYTGDGGAATACTMYKPGGLAVYGGIIYVTDMGNDAIRRIGTAVISSREDDNDEPAVAQSEPIDVKIFPNPSKGLLNIIAQTATDENMSVKVASVDGRIMYETTGRPANEQLAISTDTWTNGVYIIKMNIGTQYITKMFVVLH